MKLKQQKKRKFNVFTKINVINILFNIYEFLNNSNIRTVNLNYLKNQKKIKKLFYRL